ncbi:hypothetical protein MXL46_14105 [Heyndrickxia sporothermodurans]|uniref:hypothetical protein n=1 Tax=Heyndrickxia sporothermodurans TaxID=46224 RepID=UPI002DB9BDB0|nr:hypothetical protein [Heyndrickxia sporothermodurans]MEB6550225.1 hypothetical protein [Heyndrickxia sporothermodurans]
MKKKLLMAGALALSVGVLSPISLHSKDVSAATKQVKSVVEKVNIHTFGLKDAFIVNGDSFQNVSKGFSKNIQQIKKENGNTYYNFAGSANPSWVKSNIADDLLGTVTVNTKVSDNYVAFLTLSQELKVNEPESTHIGASFKFNELGFIRKARDYSIYNIQTKNKISTERQYDIGSREAWISKEDLLKNAVLLQKSKDDLYPSSWKNTLQQDVEIYDKRGVFVGIMPKGTTYVDHHLRLSDQSPLRLIAFKVKTSSSSKGVYYAFVKKY